MMKLNIKNLPETNLFRVLLGRKRYNHDGVIKDGFLGVFCIKSSFWKAHVNQDIDELKNEFSYDRIFILNKFTKIDYANIQENTLLVVDCFSFVQKYGLSTRLFLPAELIAIACCCCSKKLSVVFITETPDLKILQNADFIYKEEIVDLPTDLKDLLDIKTLKVGGYENYIVDESGVKIQPVNIQDMGTIV